MCCCICHVCVWTLRDSQCFLTKEGTESFCAFVSCSEHFMDLFVSLLSFYASVVLLRLTLNTCFVCVCSNVCLMWIVLCRSVVIFSHSACFTLLWDHFLSPLLIFMVLHLFLFHLGAFSAVYCHFLSLRGLSVGHLS